MGRGGKKVDFTGSRQSTLLSLQQCYRGACCTGKIRQSIKRHAGCAENWSFALLDSISLQTADGGGGSEHVNRPWGSGLREGERGGNGQPCVWTSVGPLLGCTLRHLWDGAAANWWGRVGRWIIVRSRDWSMIPECVCVGWGYSQYLTVIDNSLRGKEGRGGVVTVSYRLVTPKWNGADREESSTSSECTTGRSSHWKAWSAVQTIRRLQAAASGIKNISTGVQGAFGWRQGKKNG